jgi:pyrroloquinoline-quinone synthase
MNSNEFFAALDSRIAQYDLLCHPFYKAWSAGKLTREELREYAREYFHQVNEFPEYLREFAGRLPGGKLRSAVLANHDDEMGRDGGRPHAELWLDFLHGMGGESNSDQAAIGWSTIALLPLGCSRGCAGRGLGRVLRV